ncbi:DNA repair protein RecN [Sphingobacterium mizutaii NBRC 14946 = DSM 11724]|uniref:DNA repair protein RecN n=2 Tax=Sphingobacterium mizutaii TaxID=1010 RepID=A0AAJ4XB17_9SPHI|nr:DNA repair protein RecN [Sphingobacterium mizutaii]GEM69785.1 DNA repair protein RecN [Sphingobacterium mizutaii NBRC 14946 = DSM 11724]SDL43642.1 DNA replication and repair protein RecN [Sphingobacterium mizutaii]SNV45554.1 Recombination protein N [Sphingobacterium mizutaii]
MLSKLQIKNYALIDALDINFDDKLNIITGETGAGKSIIMGALGLILGNRAESKHFFDESRKCIIEGHFYIKDYNLQDLFNSLDLDYEDTSLIRRELHADGKSRAFVNDTPVTLQTLKVLGEKLIDIHSQHATLQINTESFQLLVLDTVAQNQSVLADYKKKYQEYKRTVAELKQLEEDLAKARSESDYQQFVFNELEQANLQDQEQEGLEAEQSQLENAEEIKRHFHAASSELQIGEINVLDSLKQALSSLQNGARYLPSSESLVDRLQSSLIELKDLSAEVEQVAEGISMDEERLSIVNERLSILYDLQKKHRVTTVKELLELKQDLENKLQATDSQGEQIEVLKVKIEKLHQEIAKLADQLTKNRSKATKIVEKEVQEVLSRVGMPHAQLNVELNKLSDFKSTGQDEVSFLFSANKGQALQPIHRVASGGELSRVMLAIKSLVAKTSALPTIIFDEIDTGISGEVALRVGELMEELAENMQVISITHLPQIASQGNSHFKVYKEDKGNKTKSNIVLMNEEERVLEIAQMLSGANPEDTAIQHAKEMLK